jgi:hypothetical protein
VDLDPFFTQSFHMMQYILDRSAHILVYDHLALPSSNVLFLAAKDKGHKGHDYIYMSHCMVQMCIILC